MTEELSTKVDALLEDLTVAVDSQQSTDEGVSEELAAVGDRADELVAETDTTDLLAAVGLGESDARPESLPEAVAEGDPQHVAALRFLLTASKLPRSTADHERLVDELGSLVETAADGSTAKETAVDGSENDSEGTDSEAEAADTDSESETTESTDDASLRDRLQSELEDTLDIFDQVPAIGDLSADDREDSSADAQNADDNGEGDGLVDSDESSRSGEGTRWRPGGGHQRTTHSTIPSGRRDIGRSGRYSSIRGSTVSKR